MNKKLIISFALTALIVLPVTAMAVTIPAAPGGTLTDFATIATNILGLMWKVFIVLFFIILFVAAFLFLTAQGDPGKLTTARQALIWAAVSLAIAVITFSLPTIIFNAICPGGVC
jgi:hypothetical protein